MAHVFLKLLFLVVSSQLHHIYIKYCTVFGRNLGLRGLGFLFTISHALNQLVENIARKIIKLKNQKKLPDFFTKLQQQVCWTCFCKFALFLLKGIRKKEYTIIEVICLNVTVVYNIRIISTLIPFYFCRSKVF